jgi:hypothetical protein
MAILLTSISYITVSNKCKTDLKVETSTNLQNPELSTTVVGALSDYK